MRSRRGMDAHDVPTIVALISPQRGHDRTMIEPRSHRDRATIVRRSWFLPIYHPPSDEDQRIQVSPRATEVAKDCDHPMKP